MHHKVGRMVIGRYETHLWRTSAIIAVVIALAVWALNAFLVDPKSPETLPLPMPFEALRSPHFEWRPQWSQALEEGEQEGVRHSDVPSSQDLLVYTVQPGDTLVTIAKHHRVSWQILWTINREMLIMNVDEYCGGLGVSYTHREDRQGAFCNHLRFGPDGTPRVFVNTVKPGDLIVIPNL